MMPLLKIWGHLNGTFINGQRITGPVAFVPGDVIQIGTSMILEVQGSGGAAASIRAASPCWYNIRQRL